MSMSISKTKPDLGLIESQVEEQLDICPICKGLVVSLWVPGQGALLHKDYVLIADWVVHTSCWEKSLEEYHGIRN